MATIIPDRLERSERYDIQNIRKAFLDDIPVYGIPHPEWKSLKDKDFHAIVGYLKAEMISLGIDWDSPPPPIILSVTLRDAFFLPSPRFKLRSVSTAN